nr:RNA-directed DNA polymerase, eukaryota, reverse transcriptase zinc-binding domain protein [Tanacetum cinerariifolium]
IGDGSNTRFWLDTWILDSPLYVRFPWLFALQSVKDISVAIKWGAPSLDASFRRRARDGAESNQWSEFFSMLDSVTLSSSPDRIFCNLNGEGEFRIKDIRSSINDTFLPSSDSATRW